MANPGTAKLNLLRNEPKIKILHYTWIAFFITFFVWFNHAPLLGSLRSTFGLSDQEIKTLLILNVALTIPARVVVGMLVDKLGPKLMFTCLLTISGVLCLLFAFSSSFEMLALTRFLMGFVGAGFVIGIRMISEWFPARQVGIAQGIYGGWGNFGSAAAAISLPTIALMFGGEDGWRYASGLSGVVALLYAAIYYFSVSDTPKGSTYFAPKKTGAMEVSSPGDFILYSIMQAPLVLALALLAWKLGPDNLGLLGALSVNLVYFGLALLYCYQIYTAYRINADIFKEKVPEIDQYSFAQVAVLNLAYMVGFGSELAVVSMLPLYFVDVFDMSAVMAGILAASFAFTNFIARPAGGWLSDVYGRKKILLFLLAGLTCGYLAMSQFLSTTWVPYVVIITLLCSLFVNAANGAVYAVAPLIKRRMTGQIAGMIGAYGNVGAVLFLTVLSFVSPNIFFLTIAGTGVLTLLAVLIFLKEPKGQMAETLPDGTVQLIDVE